MRPSFRRVIGLALAAFAAAAPAWAQAPDTVLVNGKIVTVDDRFTIAEALAISGERIVTVGTTAEIETLKGPQTRVIDLAGRTVIPGLIDNHAHWVRAAEHDELRFDGVTSRQQALKMLADRVRSTPAGEWIAVLGGWSEEQFTDEPRGFPLEELDRIAPNNPVVLQAVYIHSYLNSAALVAAKIDASTPDPQGGKIEKDAGGKPTGLVRGAGGVAFVAARVPLQTQEAWLANTRKLVAYLNSIGVTAWLDAGGRGMGAKHYEPYRHLADRGELNIRLFWTTIRQPATPAQVDEVIARNPRAEAVPGQRLLRQRRMGRVGLCPGHHPAAARREQHQAGGHGAVAAHHAGARRARPLRQFACRDEPAIDAFLNEYEAINKERPIKGLRWSFSHLDQVTEAQLERMKRLGMTRQIHSRPLIQGALMHKVHGDKAWDMPPFRRIQDSGIHWGLGSDATAVTTSNPFYTLSFAVTGRMVGGRQVNRQTITREEALIAHTRSNAVFLFQEGNLGSLAPGKYADLLVLDRDYLTVPEDEIKDIRPLITMVGGKIVHDAMPK